MYFASGFDAAGPEQVEFSVKAPPAWRVLTANFLQIANYQWLCDA
jgi:hypothetical protein